MAPAVSLAVASGEVNEFNIVTEAEAAARREQAQLDEDFVKDVMLGEIRPFWRGFLFTVFTLGLYPLFWHPIVNGEVARQTGSRSTGNVLWLAMIGVGLVGAVINIARYGLQQMPSTFESPSRLLVALVAQGLFVAFVVVQRQHLDRGFVSLGSTQRAPVVLFLGLHLLAYALTLVDSNPLIFAALVLYIIAYSIWQSTYNDFWRAVRKRVSSAEHADVAEPEDLAAYSPT